MELDQALFGYDRGHRLIASSRKLGKEATWILRNVTDMKVSKRNGHYLTVLPIPDIAVHAFIRTWAASGAFRPGSVWSHTLLVPSADLDDIDDLRALMKLFTRPTVDDPVALPDLKKPYGKRLQLPDPSAAEKISTPSVDEVVLDRIVLSAYSIEASEPNEVVVNDARQLEGYILGLMSQRWSHLRQAFSARTRFRPSQTSAARFDLEIVERSSGTSESSPTRSTPSWAVVLRDDLQRRNTELRAFLRTHASEPADQPDAIAKIADVFTSASESPAAGAEAIGRWFPNPSDRLDLKRELFGPQPLASRVIRRWPTTDPERLQILLTAPPKTVALADYQVGTRLADWAKTAPAEAAVTVVASDIPSRSQADVDELVAGIAAGFDTSWVGKLVGTLPSLAPTLLGRRPDVWSSPELWTTEVDHDLLVDLVTEAEPRLRQATYVALLSSGLAGAGGELLQRDPTLWWSILDPEHADQVADDEVAIAGARRLAMAVTSTRGACPWPLTTLNQAMVVASVTDPDEGVWRNVAADLWVKTYAVDLPSAGDDNFAPVRRDVMALGAALGSDDPQRRRRLWSLVFPRLHSALMGSGTPIGCERTLAALLPDGPSWDWCGRLRHALARTAVRDGWSSATLNGIAKGAGGFSGEVIAIADSLRHRESRSVVEEVVDFFTGWWR